MSPIRLFILGALERRGPMHGHELRRIAEQERTPRWADVSVGSLYGALKRMAAEGSIEVDAIERQGNLPQRTVYMITQQGREEFAALREQLLGSTRLPADPVDLALQYNDGLPTDELRALIAERRSALADELESWRELVDVASPHLKGLEPVIIRHRTLRLEAEVAWHSEVLDHLDQIDC